MGIIVKVDGVDRELVKVKSDNPAGYYTTLRERMGVGDVEYIEPQIGERPDDSEEGIQVDAGYPPLEPIRKRTKR